MSEGEVDRAKANLLSDLEADLAEREQVGVCLYEHIYADLEADLAEREQVGPPYICT